MPCRNTVTPRETAGSVPDRKVEEEKGKRLGMQLPIHLRCGSGYPKVGGFEQLTLSQALGFSSPQGHAPHEENAC